MEIFLITTRLFDKIISCLIRKNGDFKPIQHVYSIQHAYWFEPHAYNHTTRLYHTARLFDTLEYNLYILCS